MWTGSGFEVLHADWPAYPRGHGLIYALNSLAEFPHDTRFFKIDNIDNCTLFVAGPKPEKDRFNQKYFHVAIWDEDLRICVSKKYIDGINEDLEFRDLFNRYIELTGKGIHCITINALLGQSLYTLEEEIISHLYESRYDTAIREISLRIEVSLRQVSGLKLSGQRLIESCFGEKGLLIPKELTNPSRLILRNTFHTYFQYIRNEFHHELASIDMISA